MIDYVVLGAVLIAFCSLSAELSSIKHKLDSTPKKINLNEYLGKNVKIDLDEDINHELEGKLVSFDNKWFELEIEKNKKKEIHYKRIENIKAITIKR